MKESIGFVVVTYMVMGQKYMGKLQKYCDARKRLRRVKGQWSEVDLSQSQSVFFVKALTNLHLVILFPYISLLLFHIYIYIYSFLILWVLRFLETETPFPSHLLKTAKKHRKDHEAPPVPGLRLRLIRDARGLHLSLRRLCVPGLVR